MAILGPELVSLAV